MMKRQMFLVGALALLLFCACKKEKSNPCDATVAANLPAVAIDSVYRDGDKIIISGNVLGVGQDDAGLTAHGVVWSLNLTPSLQNGQNKNLGPATASGRFTVTLDSIPTGDFQFRTYATNCTGTMYSNSIIHFNTKPDLWAEFTFNDSIGIAPFTVSFVNKSFGATSYLWDFGDGNTSSALNPNHEYKKPGRYTVKLVVKKDLKESVAIDTLKVKAITFNRTFDPTGGNNNHGVSVFESGDKYRIFGNRPGFSPYRLAMETNQEGILTYENITSGAFRWLSDLMFQGSNGKYYDITTQFNDAPIIIKKRLEVFDNTGATAGSKYFFEVSGRSFTGLVNLGNGKQFLCGTAGKNFEGYVVDLANEQSTKTIDIAGGNDINSGVALKVNNRIIVNYQTENTSGDQYNIISTYNLNGQSGYLVYSKKNEPVSSISAVADDQSNFYILEESASNALQLRGFNLNGDVLWTHPFEGQHTGAHSLVFTKDKNIVICYLWNNAINLKKVNMAGNTLWHKEIPMNGGGIISGMIEVADGGFLMTGGMNNRVLLIKTDFEGIIDP